MQSGKYEVRRACRNLAAIQEIRTKFGNEVTKYVQEIKPGHWTVHANSSSYQPLQTDQDDDGVPLTPLPLFGWRTTNFVESDNSAMLKYGIRSSSPFDALKLFAQIEMERASRRDSQAIMWQRQERVLTPYAKTLWDEQCVCTSEYRVQRSMASIYFVCRQGFTLYRRVDTQQPSCSCTTFGQKRIACRHIVAVIQLCGIQNRAIEAFHPCYLVRSYASAFGGKGIELPLQSLLVPAFTVRTTSKLVVV